MSPKIRRFLAGAGFGIVALVAAEIVARVDDWVRLGIPFTHTPDEDHDLKYRDWFGVRGRPFGRYRQWHLNNYGFRGPDIARQAPAGCKRVMILGASESFGLYESEGQEYPAQLQDSLATRGCYQVVNAAIVGAGLQGIVRLWENYAAQFHPDIVVIYPSPAFYLGNAPPVWTPMPGKAAPDHDLPFRLRLIESFHNVWETPDFLQKRRLEKWLAQDTVGKSTDWFFKGPPQDRLEAFGKDIDSLVKSVRADGSEPVLMTHAMRFSIPPQAGDQMLLMGWRRFSPRARPEVMLEFEVAAAQWMREYAAKENVPLVDVDKQLSGRRELFGDFVHFTNAGSSIVAGVLARGLTSQRILAPGGAQ
ncbi:MAG TPA: hypothetical protein VGM50_06370 [Gemmatimonadaceae bacterium]